MNVYRDNSIGVQQFLGHDVAVNVASLCKEILKRKMVLEKVRFPRANIQHLVSGILILVLMA